MKVLYFLCSILISFGSVTSFTSTFVSSDPPNNKSLICGEAKHEDVCRLAKNWTFAYETGEYYPDCALDDLQFNKGLNKSLKFLSRVSSNLTKYPVINSDVCGENCNYFAAHQDEFHAITSVGFFRVAQLFRIKIEFVRTTDEMAVLNKDVYIIPGNRALDRLSNHPCKNESFYKENKKRINKENKCPLKLALQKCVQKTLGKGLKKFFQSEGFQPLFWELGYN